MVDIIWLDRATRAFTSFSGFKALINAGGNYVPTLRHDHYGPGLHLLALQYNRAQERRGDPRRVPIR